MLPHSLNDEDNVYIINSDRIHYINILSFLTSVRFNNNDYYNYDLRQSTKTIVRPNKTQLTKNVVSTTDDWKKNIQPKVHKPRTHATASVNIRLGGVY